METPPTPEQQKQEPVGPFVAIIIVVLIMAVGGIYFFLNEQNKLHPAPPLESSGQARLQTMRA